MHGGKHAPGSSSTQQMKGAWYFFALPRGVSAQIKKAYAPAARGWGSIRVTATIGSTTWKTSIFPDSKLGAYVLPVKAAVRKAGGVGDGDRISVRLLIGV